MLEVLLLPATHMHTRWWWWLSHQKRIVMRCLGRQIVTSGAVLEWKVIPMWDYPMIKQNCNILRVLADFGWRLVYTEMFKALKPYIDSKLISIHWDWMELCVDVK